MEERKVLIVTYYWPPSAGSGVQRWLKFAKYLNDFGWKPYIYTPANPDFDLNDETLLNDVHPSTTVVKRKIWEPYALAKKLSRDKKINVGVVGDGPKRTSKVKKVMNWVRGNFFIPDPRVYWRKPSVKFLNEYLRKHNIKYIITTGPPHSMHLIGLDLKRSNNLKWIVDIRDPWSKLDFLDTFYISKRNRKKYQRMEMEVLSEADHVIATSPSMKDQILLEKKEKFTCITNGYDQDDFKALHPQHTNDRIVLYHAGLLNQMRNPKNLWLALDQLCQVDQEVDQKLHIHLAGVIDQEVVDWIKQHKFLEDKLEVEGYKSHTEVLKDYARSNVLLLLINNTDNSQVNIPGKLFEYIASKKKVLSISDQDSDAAQVIKEEGLGVNYGYDELIDPSDLQTFIESKTVIRQDQTEKFSRKTLTHKLIKVLESL